MAVHLFYGRILSASLAVSLVASLVVSVGTANPARAGDYLTHPAEKPALAATPSAATLFKKGAEIKVKKDANLYITARNIPENDRLLEAYNADRPNGGRVQTRLGEASAVPGLLGIANQAHRAQDPNGQNAQAYSLADAMRDAIWRKNTAARLKSLTLSQNACADGSATRTPSIGLAARC
jgi:hypothetical protein